jgi:hypothetical protein
LSRADAVHPAQGALHRIVLARQPRLSDTAFIAGRDPLIQQAKEQPMNSRLTALNMIAATFAAVFMVQASEAADKVVRLEPVMITAQRATIVRLPRVEVQVRHNAGGAKALAQQDRRTSPSKPYAPA